MTSLDNRIENCVFPVNYFYNVDNFTWTKSIDELNDATDDVKEVLVGITPVYSYITGKILKFKLKAAGTDIVRDKSLGTVESLNHFGIIRSPVSGQIMEINDEIIHNPKVVNDSPFDSGWIARIKTNDNLKSLKSIKSIDECKYELESQIKKFNVKCFKLFPDFQMYELGTECSATLAKLSEFMMKNMRIGNVIRLVSDDPTADLELIRWADENKQEIVEIVQETNPVQSSLSNSSNKYLFNIIIKKIKDQV
jgi:glycine cleavage system H lipoate-binding protein/TusA-related sulfurtransferase